MESRDCMVVAGLVCFVLSGQKWAEGKIALEVAWFALGALNLMFAIFSR